MLSDQKPPPTEVKARVSNDFLIASLYLLSVWMYVFMSELSFGALTLVIFSAAPLGILFLSILRIKSKKAPVNYVLYSIALSILVNVAIKVKLLNNDSGVFIFTWSCALLIGAVSKIEIQDKRTSSTHNQLTKVSTIIPFTICATVVAAIVGTTSHFVYEKSSQNVSKTYKYVIYCTIIGMFALYTSYKYIKAKNTININPTQKSLVVSTLTPFLIGSWMLLLADSAAVHLILEKLEMLHVTNLQKYLSQGLYWWSQFLFYRGCILLSQIDGSKQQTHTE